VDLSAYRIIQEALTNVIKHAACPTAHVTVRYGRGSVTLEITDDGPGTPPAGAQAATSSTGHGIIGMRERVAVFGGEFAAGPRPEGGFRVFACLPVPEVTEVTS
jgi:signal transduction histidine kinase